MDADWTGFVWFFLLNVVFRPRFDLTDNQALFEKQGKEKLEYSGGGSSFPDDLFLAPPLPAFAADKQGDGVLDRFIFFLSKQRSE